MKGSLTTPESADPYAVLETILKISGRFWLSEEWRLEDIRLLAQDAIARRGGKSRKPLRPGARSPRPQKHRTE